MGMWHPKGYSFFGLKTGVHFAHHDLESGIVFKGTEEGMNLLVISIPNK